MTPPPSARRSIVITVAAAVGLGLTFAAMIAFDATSTLGAIAFAPWVGLIGFDAGILGGAAATAAATGLWVLAVRDAGNSAGGGQLAVRLAAFFMLGVGTAWVGQRLRRSEAALRDLTSLQTALIDSTLDGICLTDAANNLLISNAPLRRISVEVGLPPTGTLPERLLAIADRITEPERYRTRMLELAASTDSETSDVFELAGTGRSFRGFTSPVFDATRRISGRVWTLREVTADRELDRMRDAFIATVSHELRTPLTSISGFLEMMQDEEAAIGESGRTYLDVIRRSTERLNDLVEDLLLIAQIEAHRVELALERVDLAAIVARCVEAAHPTAAAKDVALELTVEEPSFVEGDRRRLAQVIDNLISNGVKFTGSGGSVSVTVGYADGNARLVVADTGVGIPAAEQPQVFSRFFRASTATRRAIPGTGLGLAISRALVEQHGGTVVLESEEGRGTRALVTLPRAA